MRGGGVPRDPAVQALIDECWGQRAERGTNKGDVVGRMGDTSSQVVYTMQYKYALSIEYHTIFWNESNTRGEFDPEGAERRGTRTCSKSPQKT